VRARDRLIDNGGADRRLAVDQQGDGERGHFVVAASLSTRASSAKRARVSGGMSASVSMVSSVAGSRVSRSTTGFASIGVAFVAAAGAGARAPATGAAAARGMAGFAGIGAGAAGGR
jgi:hypothetical protein